MQLPAFYKDGVVFRAANVLDYPNCAVKSSKCMTLSNRVELGVPNRNHLYRNSK